MMDLRDHMMNRTDWLQKMSPDASARPVLSPTATLTVAQVEALVRAIVAQVLDERAQEARRLQSAAIANINRIARPAEQIPLSVLPSAPQVPDPQGDHPGVPCTRGPGLSVMGRPLEDVSSILGDKPASK